MLNDMSNFDEIFGNVVAYLNIKRHKRPVFYPLSTKHIFGKTTSRNEIDPPVILLPTTLFRINAFIYILGIFCWFSSLSLCFYHFDFSLMKYRISAAQY